MKRKKTIFRKWFNDGSDHYFMITPEGHMREIEISNNLYYIKVCVTQTKALNPLSAESFIKHKDVCTALEWCKAQEKVKNILLNGKL